MSPVEPQPADLWQRLGAHYVYHRFWGWLPLGSEHQDLPRLNDYACDEALEGRVRAFQDRWWWSRAWCWFWNVGHIVEEFTVWRYHQRVADEEGRSSSVERAAFEERSVSLPAFGAGDPLLQQAALMDAQLKQAWRSVAAWQMRLKVERQYPWLKRAKAADLRVSDLETWISSVRSMLSSIEIEADRNANLPLDEPTHSKYSEVVQYWEAQIKSLSENPEALVMQTPGLEILSRVTRPMLELLALPPQPLEASSESLAERDASIGSNWWKLRKAFDPSLQEKAPSALGGTMTLNTSLDLLGFTGLEDWTTIRAQLKRRFRKKMLVFHPDRMRALWAPIAEALADGFSPSECTLVRDLVLGWYERGAASINHAHEKVVAQLKQAVPRTAHFQEIFAQTPEELKAKIAEVRAKILEHKEQIQKLQASEELQDVDWAQWFQNLERPVQLNDPLDFDSEAHWEDPQALKGRLRTLEQRLHRMVLCGFELNVLKVKKTCENVRETCAHIKEDTRLLKEDLSSLKEKVRVLHSQNQALPPSDTQETSITLEQQIENLSQGFQKNRREMAAEIEAFRQEMLAHRSNNTPATFPDPSERPTLSATTHPLVDAPSTLPPRPPKPSPSIVATLLAGHPACNHTPSSDSGDQDLPAETVVTPITEEVLASYHGALCLQGREPSNLLSTSDFFWVPR